MTRLSKLPIKMSAGLGLSMIDRAVKEAFASARCLKADLGQLRDFFAIDGDLRCFYCEAVEPTRWDHLHAVSRGGETLLGNLVPACARCDDSKQNRDVDEWVASKSKHRSSLERLPVLQARIAAYQQHFGYVPVEFEQRLSPEQLRRYRRFREQITAFRRYLEEEGLLQAK